MKELVQEKFLTLKEAAKYLEVGERTLFRHVHDGRIKAAKIGSWRFRKKDLDDFIEQSFRTYPRQKKAD